MRLINLPIKNNSKCVGMAPCQNRMLIAMEEPDGNPRLFILDEFNNVTEVVSSFPDDCNPSSPAT